jgi:hypothetical protein
MVHQQYTRHEHDGADDTEVAEHLDLLCMLGWMS